LKSQISSNHTLQVKPYTPKFIDLSTKIEYFVIPEVTVTERRPPFGRSFGPIIAYSAPATYIALEPTARPADVTAFLVAAMRTQHWQSRSLSPSMWSRLWAA
jgi:hypothetical protein